MRYRVLGSVDLLAADQVVHVPAEKERTLLAALLTSPNRALSTVQLTDELWASSPPATSAKTLQTYVSHLRRHLGDDLETVPGGYRIVVDRAGLDSMEFERLVSEARVMLLRGDHRVAATTFADAFALWRGDPFDTVSGGDLVRNESARLRELRLDALEDSFESRLLSGDRNVITDLEGLAEANPFRERLWALLMEALYRAGRQAEALQAYQRARRHLVDELGIEPGPELREVERAVLTQELPALEPTPATPTVSYAVNAAGLQIAYSVLGDGRRPIVFVGDIYMNFDLLWDFDAVAPILDRLAGLGRLIAVQRRGTGASDREVDGSFVNAIDCVGDIDAVLEAAAVVDPIALVGWGHGGQVAIAHAATRPESVSHLVVINSYPRLRATADYPDGYSSAFLDAWVAGVELGWGKQRSVAAVAGPLGDDHRFITRLARLERLTASPRSASALHRALNDMDVRDLVPHVRAPALVVYSSHSVSGRGGARWLGSHLSDARFVEVPGFFLPTHDEALQIASQVESFLHS